MLLLETEDGQHPVLTNKPANGWAPCPAGARWWPEQHCFYAWDPHLGNSVPTIPVISPPPICGGTAPTYCRKTATSRCVPGATCCILRRAAMARNLSACTPRNGNSMPAAWVQSSRIVYNAPLDASPDHIWMTADSQGCVLLGLWGEEASLYYLDRERGTARCIRLHIPAAIVQATINPQVALEHRKMRLGPNRPGMLLCGKTLWLTLRLPANSPGRVENVKEEGNNTQRWHDSRLYRIDLTDIRARQREPVRYASVLRPAGRQVVRLENFAMAVIAGSSECQFADLAYYTARNCYDPVTGQALEEPSVSPLLLYRLSRIDRRAGILAGSQGVEDPAAGSHSLPRGNHPLWPRPGLDLRRRIPLRLNQNGCVERYDLQRLTREHDARPVWRISLWMTRATGRKSGCRRA